MLSDLELKNKFKTYGKLDKGFSDEKLLLDNINHKDKEIRYLSVLNLAKLSNLNFLSIFKKLLKTESSSKVRRELASAIGRLRSEKCIDTLYELLDDKDPNVILQAIRGLLVFKKDKDVKNKLLRLKTHKNEIIKKIIKTEFETPKKNDKDLVVQSPERLQNCVINDDAFKVLKKVDDESIHLTFTSPPYYNARDYSIYSSYDEYISFMSKIFKEVHRVTKDGRFLVLNTSPIIMPRPGRKYSSTRYPIPYDIHSELVKMGWEFIDDILWVKPEPSAKNRVAGFEMHRKPLAYKPNCVTEQIMVYRKESTKLIDWIYKQYPPGVIEESEVGDGYESSNVWNISPKSSKKHSAIFPTELCDRVINYYSFKGDLIYDPFAGSGSVGVSAIRNDRKFFLTELNETYFQDMIERLQNDLFHEIIKTEI